MTDIKEFLSQENLNKMNRTELMNIWSFILSDIQQLDMVYTIKERLEIIDNKKGE